jgi:hypothetical protein
LRAVLLLLRTATANRSSVSTIEKRPSGSSTPSRLVTDHRHNYADAPSRMRGSLPSPRVTAARAPHDRQSGHSS